jgi:sulfate transport system substrate-binding protein
VRKGNPKGIKDWEDLVKPGVAVITPNPKTSGGARWNYLAAWGYTLAKFCGADKAKWQNCAEGEKQAQDFVTRLYKNVPVLDSGARGATTTFIKRGIGDVFISWENEAFLVVNKIGGKGKFEIIVPSISILAEPPVAVVEETAKKKGTLEVAKAYLEYLYTETGQRLAAKHYYRPRVETLVTPNEIKQFPHLELFTIEDFGGWQKAQATHFNDGGIFDQIYLPPSE